MIANYGNKAELELDMIDFKKEIALVQKNYPQYKNEKNLERLCIFADKRGIKLNRRDFTLMEAAEIVQMRININRLKRELNQRLTDKKSLYLLRN